MIITSRRRVGSFTMKHGMALGWLVMSVWQPGNAFAAEYTINQYKNLFAVKTVHVKTGDEIIFTNSDDHLHNLYSKSDAFKFDSRAMKPGAIYRLTPDKTGTIFIRCAIHPKMKVKVIVE